jgi:glycosyltransferase involved in cell wall biosynthesis
MTRIEVVHFTRKPREGQFSIENVFQAVRGAFAERIHCRVEECPYEGGWLGRAANTLHARRRRGRINHITGDVHYLAAVLPKASLVLTIHDAAAIERMAGMRRRLYRYLWFDMPARRARVITVISEATREVVVRELGLPAKKIRVVPDCISPAFRPLPRVGSGGPFVLLQVGTQANKNIERLAAALADLPCVLEVVGRLSESQEAAIRHNRIELRNSWNLTEAGLMEKYQACSAVALVSTVEGFGMPIIEAQTVGRPVITSNVSAMPEVAGDGACLVDPLDVASIRAGVSRMIEDEAYREDLVRRGFKNAERFSVRSVADAYTSIYDELEDELGRQQSGVAAT